MTPDKEILGATANEDYDVLDDLEPDSIEKAVNSVLRKNPSIIGLELKKTHLYQNIKIELIRVQ